MRLPHSWKETYLIIPNKRNIFLLRCPPAAPPPPLTLCVHCPLHPNHKTKTKKKFKELINLSKVIKEKSTRQVSIFGHFLTVLINYVPHVSTADTWLAGGAGLVRGGVLNEQIKLDWRLLEIFSTRLIKWPVTRGSSSIQHHRQTPSWEFIAHQLPSISPLKVAFNNSVRRLIGHFLFFFFFLDLYHKQTRLSKCSSSPVWYADALQMICFFTVFHQNVSCHHPRYNVGRKRSGFLKSRLLISGCREKICPAMCWELVRPSDPSGSHAVHGSDCWEKEQRKRNSVESCRAGEIKRSKPNWWLPPQTH